MKFRKTLFIILLQVVLSITGCDLITQIEDNVENHAGSVTGSGNLVTINEPFTDFSAVSLSHSFDATIVRSSEFYVILRVDDNVVDYLHNYKDGSVLCLGLISGSYSNVHLTAEIGMPDITAVYMSGASKINLNGYQFDHSFNIDISGASVVSGNITTGDLYCHLSGASAIDLVGEGDDIFLECSGASNLNFYNFPADNLDIELSGASSATVNVSGLMNLHVSGVSTLYYTGDPTIGIIDVSGESRITKID